jgi:hypothetical protein
VVDGGYPALKDFIAQNTLYLMTALTVLVAVSLSGGK